LQTGQGQCINLNNILKINFFKIAMFDILYKKQDCNEKTETSGANDG